MSLNHRHQTHGSLLQRIKNSQPTEPGETYKGHVNAIFQGLGRLSPMLCRRDGPHTLFCSCAQFGGQQCSLAFRLLERCPGVAVS